MSRLVLALGQRRGVRVDVHRGPWLSLGVHIHWWRPGEAHLDLHLGWFLITVGRHYA